MSRWTERPVKTALTRAQIRPGTFTSRSLFERLQNAGNCSRESYPAFGFLLHFAAALTRELIESGSASGVSQSPFRLDQSLLFHPIERGIERAFLNAQYVRRELMDFGSDAVTVHWTSAQCLERKQVECALQ